ncbi:MAG TPA: hypothetical protein VMG09_04990 [Bacteroidota bacterium]|nr:hypothetical protein [Bacteroidota bacterium]
MRRLFVTLRLQLLVLGALLTFGLSPARSQNVSMTTDDLARQADVVAVGHVSSLVPQWDETHSRIRTQVTIAVSQNVKGTSAGSTLTLLVPGGELDGVGEMYSDIPVFRRDEDVVVFAQRSVQGSYRVAGGLLGKFTVAKDELTGRAMVSDRLSVDEFASQLRSAIEAHPLKQ